MLDCIEDERKVLNEKEVSQFMRVIGGEEHGHAKFGGSVYGPRLVDTMDEFARASVKSGVNPRRINRLVAQHQHKHANSAKSSSNKKKSNRN